MFRVVQASLSEFIQIGQSAGTEDGSVDPALVKFVQRMQGNARSVRAPPQTALAALALAIHKRVGLCVALR